MLDLVGGIQDFCLYIYITVRQTLLVAAFEREMEKVINI